MTAFLIPTVQSLGNYPPAIQAALVALATALQTQNPTVKAVRDLAVASLGAGPAVVDGVTCLAGDLVLVAAQATGLQNGLYQLGTPTGLNASAVAAYTRPDQWAAGGAIVPGTIVDVAGQPSAITQYGGGQWKTFGATGGVIDTDDPKLFPGAVKYTSAVATGGVTPSFSAFIASATGTSIIPVVKVAGSPTYGTPRVGTMIAGIKGVGAISIASSNPTDTSSYDVTVINF